MPDSGRFKTDAREMPLRNKQHQEGATLDIASFSPAGHKRTDSVSGATVRGRCSAAVSPELRHDTHEHARGGRRDE